MITIGQVEHHQQQSRFAQRTETPHSGRQLQLGKAIVPAEDLQKSSDLQRRVPSKGNLTYRQLVAYILFATLICLNPTQNQTNAGCLLISFWLLLLPSLLSSPWTFTEEMLIMKPLHPSDLFLLLTPRANSDVALSQQQCDNCRVLVLACVLREDVEDADSLLHRFAPPVDETILTSSAPSAALSSSEETMIGSDVGGGDDTSHRLN